MIVWKCFAALTNLPGTDPIGFYLLSNMHIYRNLTCSKIYFSLRSRFASNLLFLVMIMILILNSFLLFLMF